MNPALDLAVDALAAHRLVRLLGADTITEPLREAVARWAYTRRGRDADDLEAAPDGGWALWAEHGDPDPPKLATLVTCRWCLSIYVAAAVVAASQLAPRPWRLAARGLALSSAAVLLSGLEQD